MMAQDLEISHNGEESRAMGRNLAQRSVIFKPVSVETLALEGVCSCRRLDGLRRMGREPKFLIDGRREICYTLGEPYQFSEGGQLCDTHH